MPRESKFLFLSLLGSNDTDTDNDSDNRDTGSMVNVIVNVSDNGSTSGNGSIPLSAKKSMPTLESLT